ncbi:MAG TPA: enoyl-CoA hydratase/isomerase family protein [Steroidobacteraceae bacterium]|nr:enoyl-CoA hydratase/isomerase family protein [Steroidobacteraceae bacterium]
MTAADLPKLPQNADRAAREQYLRAHAAAIYEHLTDGRREFVRVDELCRRAAEAFPGLTPSAAELADEAPRLQRDKRGLEVHQGLFLAHVLADPACGLHLCHAMLLPRAESREKLAEFEKRGELDLGGAKVQREGRAAIVTMNNPRFLNAEDESTLAPLETAIDLALLDTKSEICVLRGGPVSHPKHAGKRLFGAGINLTHLYHGRIRYLWFILRDMGLVNKLYRGVAFPDVPPEEGGREKPWIAAVEGFAIGGHCQILVAVDHTIAAADAYMTLPARKEGIIPGAANLRMARFTGDRIAREAVMNDLRLDCDSPEGRMICSEIVPPGTMDAAIANTVERLTGSGVVSAAGNRRAFRIAQEPLDIFRRYMSVYAREQAYCHFSPQLIANLERNWNAASRRA